ncbi:MAG: UDP-glucose 4-epimerase GalE [Clostridia bacterium]|nr:UDP-glucose 4-epimerase GalE [Clostridia bacterium]
MSKILVTGGTGYIGSHTCVELLNAGYEIVVIDNFCNSSPKSAARVKKITGKDFKVCECDIRDKDGLKKVFEAEKPDAVIHFAGLKAVGESCVKPLEYYENNIWGTVALLEVMRDCGCKRIVFSSSATVYGSENKVPFVETMPVGTATNPYGTTKIYIENILQDLYKADNEWSIELLRYFNPIGAHPSGQIGENPNGIPNNLMPYIAQVAVGKREMLSVYGNDYPTPDGTGVRDYIHVVDLAVGHIKAVTRALGKTGVDIYNLGTGIGYSVLDIVNTFMEVNKINIPYKIVDRRPGDIAECYANADKAKEELGWVAALNLADMCRDTWNWQKNNPNGYDD